MTVAVARERWVTVVLGISMACLTVLMLAVIVGVLGQGQLPVADGGPPGDGVAQPEPAPGDAPDDATTDEPTTPDLTTLATACAAGDLASCDTLYLESPVGSEEEAIGSTCGDRAPETLGSCVAWGDAQGGAVERGQSEALDDLWDACAVDGGEACAVLWRITVEGSPIHDFAATCGSRGLDPRASCSSS